MTSLGGGAKKKDVEDAVEDEIDWRGEAGRGGSAAGHARESFDELDAAEKELAATEQFSQESASFDADGPGDVLDVSVLGPLASEMEGGDHSSDLIAAAMALLDDGSPAGPPDRPASRGSQADPPHTTSRGGSAGSTRLSARLPGETAGRDDDEIIGNQEYEERRGLLSERGSTARTERSAADVTHTDPSCPIPHSAVFGCLVHRTRVRSPQRGARLASPPA